MVLGFVLYETVDVGYNMLKMTYKQTAIYIVLLSVLVYVLLSFTDFSENRNVEENTKFKAVTTFTVIADIARNIAGNAAIVESITKPGAEIHDYQPTPKDIIRAKGADVILWNGMNLEQWFEQFLSNLDGIPAVTITDGIEPIIISNGKTPPKFLSTNFTES